MSTMNITPKLFDRYGKFVNDYNEQNRVSQGQPTPLEMESFHGATMMISQTNMQRVLGDHQVYALVMAAYLSGKVAGMRGDGVLFDVTDSEGEEVDGLLSN